MKSIAIAVIAMISLSLILFVRNGHVTGSLIHAFPLLGGYQPGIYDLAGLMMLIIFIRGLCGIGSPSGDTSSAEDEENEEADVEETEDNQTENISE